MNKSKKTMKSIIKYLRELSVVVAGIALTIGVGIWINYNNSIKDQKQYLEAINMELETNAKQFDWCIKWLQKPLRYVEYLEANYKKPLNNDSLQYYGYTDSDECGFGYVELLSPYFRTNAFEMFKISGTMRQIDKTLLQSIWDIYSRIETAKSNLDRLMRIKEEEAIKLRHLRYIEGKEVDWPMIAFYVSGYPGEMVRYCEQTSEAIKDVLVKFEQAGVGK